MDVSASSWLVILAAIAGANLPFLNESLLGVIPLKWPYKPVWARLLELLAMYGVVGLLGHWLEGRIGDAFVQTWEFYAITACLFLVLAYPGFVWRYLRKQRQAP